MSGQFLERGRVAPMTTLAPDVVAAMGRTVPVGQVILCGGVRVGEVAIRASTLLGLRMGREPEYRDQSPSR
jgi:hypothetical protein